MPLGKAPRMALFEPSPFVSVRPGLPRRRSRLAGILGSRTPHRVAHEIQQYSPEKTSHIESLEAESGLERTLREHDEEMISRYNSDIDTLLVFAGLFAAVLATFNVQSYQSLQGDQTPSWAVQVNAIWFAALICSLFSASLGILVKQWFREYLNWKCTATEERLRVRHIRYMALLQWRVFETAAILPLLLQFSLLLFFAGLSVLLKTLSFTVWLSTTTLIACWFIPYIFTLFSPAFSSQCPYKTPLLDKWMQLFRGLWSRLLHGNDWRSKLGYGNHYYRFPGDERGVRRDIDLDIPAIVSADATLGDNQVLSQNIQHCLRRAPGETVVTIVRGLFANRLDRSVKSLFRPEGLERIPTQSLRILVQILLNTVETWPRAPLVTWPSWMREAVSCLASIIKHSQENNRFIKPDRSFRVFSEILSVGVKQAEELLVILTYHFPIVEWHFRSGDHDLVLSHTIRATRNLISSARDHPMRLASSVLSIIVSLDRLTLQKRRTEIFDLTILLAPTIRAHRMSLVTSHHQTSKDDRETAEHILASLRSLDDMLPGVVSEGVLDDIQRIRGENLDPQAHQAALFARFLTPSPVGLFQGGRVPAPSTYEQTPHSRGYLTQSGPFQVQPLPPVESSRHVTMALPPEPPHTVSPLQSPEPHSQIYLPPRHDNPTIVVENYDEAYGMPTHIPFPEPIIMQSSVQSPPPPSQLSPDTSQLSSGTRVQEMTTPHVLPDHQGWGAYSTTDTDARNTYDDGSTQMQSRYTQSFQGYSHDSRPQMDGGSDAVGSDFVGAESVSPLVAFRPRLTLAPHPDEYILDRMTSRSL